jgi:hypothetical protein
MPGHRGSFRAQQADVFLPRSLPRRSRLAQSRNLSPPFSTPRLRPAFLSPRLRLPGPPGHQSLARRTLQTPRQRTNLPTPRYWTRLHRQPAAPHPPRHPGAHHRNHRLLAVRPCQGPRRMLRRRKSPNTPRARITWRPLNARRRRPASLPARAGPRASQRCCPSDANGATVEFLAPACRSRPARRDGFPRLGRPLVREIPVPQRSGFPSHQSTTYVETSL